MSGTAVNGDDAHLLPVALPYQSYGTVAPARQLTRREQLVLACHSHGACVSFLSILDGVQLGLAMLDVPLMACFAWGPLAGWRAGRDFSVRWLIAYSAYYVLSTHFILI